MKFIVKVSTDIESKYDPGDVVCFKLFSDEICIGMILSCTAHTYNVDEITRAKIRYRIICYDDNNKIYTQYIDENDIITAIKKEDFDCIEANYEKYKEEN